MEKFQNEMLQGGFHNRRHQESRRGREKFSNGDITDGALLWEVLLELVVCWLKLQNFNFEPKKSSKICKFRRRS